MAHPPRAAGVSTLAVPGPSDQAAGAQVQHRAGPARALQRVKTSGAALAWVLSVHTRSRRQAAPRSMREMPGGVDKTGLNWGELFGQGIEGTAIFFESRPIYPRLCSPPSGLPAISPFKGGDQSLRLRHPSCDAGDWRNQRRQLISPLEGEMAGRPEGGEHRRGKIGRLSKKIPVLSIPWPKSSPQFHPALSTPLASVPYSVLQLAGGNGCAHSIPRQGRRRMS